MTQSVTIMMQQLKSFLIPSTDNMFLTKMSLMIAKMPVTGTRTMVFSQLTSTGQNLFVCTKYISSAPWISTVYGFWAPLLHYFFSESNAL